MKNKYIEYYLSIFKNNNQIHNKTINKDNKPYFFIMYNSQMIDKKSLNLIVIKELLESIAKDYDLEHSSLVDLKEINVFSKEEIENNIYSGGVIIFSLKEKKLYSINLANMISRTPSLDSQEIVYSGSKDNLIESLDTNLSLIYKRLKTSELINEMYTIGSLSKTRVSLLHLNNFIDDKLLDNIKKSIQDININALTSIGDFATHLYKRKNIVPMLTYCSKVDLLEQALLSGKVIIIIDGIPEGIVLPISLFTFSSYDDAINESFIVTLFNKVFSLLGMFISLFFLGLYTSIILYEPDLIPYNILINIYNSYKGVALSSQLELIVVYLFFQIFFHAGNKSLSGLSGSLLIIGSLLIGQVAVSSGFISQITLIIVAISIFSCFIISNNIALNTSFMFLQLIIFISSLLFGLVGYLVSLLLILIYLNSLESFTIPYLYPFSNLNFTKIKESFFSSTYLKKKGKKKWKKQYF